MGKNRDLYFEKNIRNAPTVEKYIENLALSPYKTHRRMSLALLPVYEKLKDGLSKEEERFE